MKIFWSWQSDTPGRTGRHFVRDALKAAIETLREAEDVEEPRWREIREQLNLDQDRAGVSGSPDLAATILAKIDVASVFVGDVTPVSIVPANPPRTEKRNMNPNVAIELGYAMRALGDRKLLMVLNEHYGARDFLPFDLKHKAGPILFNLAPGATSTEIKAASKALTGQLVDALRPYIEQAVSQVPSEVRRQPAGASSAVFYQPGSVLANIGVERDDDQVLFTARDGNGVFLRVVPIALPSKPFSSGILHRLANERGLAPLWHYQNAGIRRGNDYGAISFEPRSQNSGELLALTQVLRSGELWGVNQKLLVDHPQQGKLIPPRPFEETLRRSLGEYCTFIADTLELPPPYLVVGGAVGLAGRYIPTGQWSDSWYGPIHENEFSVERILSTITDEALDEVVVAVSDDLFRLTGYPRPYEELGLLAPRNASKK